MKMFENIICDIFKLNDKIIINNYNEIYDNDNDKYIITVTVINNFNDYVVFLGKIENIIYDIFFEYYNISISYNISDNLENVIFTIEMIPINSINEIVNTSIEEVLNFIDTNGIKK